MGGVANRNWPLLIKIANLLPEIRFCCVASQIDWQSKVHDKPNNVLVYFNTPFEQYYSLMRQASLILLPLVQDVSSGLINVIKAGQFRTICLASDFEAIGQYFSGTTRQYLLPNDPQVWADKIRQVASYTPEQYEQAAEAFQSYIRDTFSPVATGEKLRDTIYELLGERTD